MKLHLPQSLRGALLACFASVAGLTTTMATGAFAGGVFYVSLSQVAQAADVAVTTDTTWANADAATHADDTVTVGDATAEDAITLQVGQGNTNALTAGQAIDFGTVTVNAGDTLKLHIWTTKAADNLATQMVTINSAITLNNAGILLEDGAYNFAESITITGESILSVNWEKGTILTSIVGDESAVLKLVRNGNADGWDKSPALIELTGKNEDFRGTLKLDDQFSQYDGVGLKLVISHAEALINAVLDLGENDDAALRIRTQQALLKAIKGHGFIEYSPLEGQASTTELVVSAASGDYAGTSAANVNWTISGGTQGLSNASILGTYTVGEGASSTFEGAITLGSLVNNSTTGIDVTNMTSLTINNQQAYQGATITGLGTLTGLSDGNTFSYGNGWLATYDSASGTATLSDAAVYWSDAGADDNINWNEATNWSSSAVPAATDAVRLTADNAGKTIALTDNATVQELRVYGAYTLSVGAGASYSLTATDGIHLMSETAGLSKSGAGTLTLTNVTANALGSSAGNLVVNTLNVYTGDTFTKTGDGLMTLTNADTLLGKNIKVEAGELHITQTGDIQVTNGSTTTVTVNSGATLDDDRRLRVTGGSLSVTGGGIYELGGICLSGFGATATILNVNADTVLHITGTTQSAEGNQGSFMLSNWPAGNVINIRGLLVSDAGISDRDGSGTLHVEDGGVLQLNAGMSRTNHGDKDTIINIKEGASLVVNGDSTTHTDYITTNLAAGATVFTTDGATILNAMHYNGAVELGAAADTILTLTAAAPNVGTITILGTGDTVKTFADDAVTQTSAGGTVKYTNAVSGTAITLNEGAKFEAAAGLNLSGVLTLAANAEAKLGGAVTLGSVANAGTIDVSELQSLRLGADTGSMGATVNLGTVTYTAGNTFTYGNGWTATWQDNGTALITGDAAIAWADTGAEGDTDINWTTAGNWSGGAAPTATDYVQLAATEGVTRTLVLTADTTVAGMRVYDAYTLSVGEGVTAAFTATNGVELNGETAKLSKAGTGTLSMSSAQAIATKMNVTEGTLKLTDHLAGAPLNTVAAQDLSALSSSASGVLAVTAGGAAGTPGASANNNNQGPTVSAISLANTFTGTVEVLGGKLSVTKSNFGGTSLMNLNGGGLLVSSNGTTFGTQELAYNLHVGDNGGYLDHYGSSTSKEDSWSSRHTGTMTGSGVLTLIGYGEWMFAGTYTDFTGSIKFGSQAQRVYLSSDMAALSGLLATATEVAVGYKTTGNSAVTVAVSGKETLGGNRTMYFANCSTFTHSGGVEVAAGQTLSVQSYTSGQTGTFNAANVELAAGSGDTAAAILSVGTGIEANLTNTAAYTATAGTISIDAGATVNDSRALTIDGAYTISGAGEYKQLGSLALTTNGALTLSGVVSIASLAGNNAGTITLADTLTSLRLDDFAIGTEYAIGNVADGGTKDWNTLLGYDAKQYSIAYADGVLASEYLGDIVWASPADEDIAWGGTDNWQVAGNAVSVAANDAVILPTPMDGLSSTIAITANTTVAKVTVQDAYAFSVAEEASYSFDAGSIVLEQGGSLGKVGAGTLIMSNADALAAGVHITGGALQLSDTQGNTVNSDSILPGASNTNTWRESGLLVDLSGISAGADGTLQLTLAGQTSTGNDSTRLQLAESFAGKVEVLCGQLGHASSLGGATQVILNGGGIVFNNDGDEANNNSTVFATPVHVASGSTGALRAWEAYSHLAAAVSSLTGDDTATLQKYDSGAIRLDELSGFAGEVEIHQGKLILNDATESATLSSLYMVAGSQLVLEAGQQLTVENLVEGAYIDLNGASSLTVNAVNSNGVLDFEGDAAAGASFAVDENDTFTLAHDGLTLGALTNAGAGTLKLKGAVSLGDLYNESGILDLSDVTALSISNMQYAIGAEYHVGQFIGVGTDAFLALIGNGGNSFLSASYNDETGMVSFNASTYWKDNGADGNNVWADASNWSTGEAEGFSLANATVKLGDEAAGRNILLQSNVEATTTVHVAEAYTFSVAADESYAFNGTLQYADDHVQALTKAGEGTLTVNLAQATANGGMHIEEGRLVVLGNVAEGNGGTTVTGGYTANGPHDLSAISAGANGILSVALYGNVANNVFDSSALTLAENFTGTLEVTHGYLLIHYNDSIKSTLGGTAKIRLDGGGVALYGNDVLDKAIEVGAKGGWLLGRAAGNEYSGNISGAGNMTLVSHWGVDVLTFSGSMTLEDYTGQDENGAATTAKSNLVKKGDSVVYITGADNNINISGGVIAEAGQLVFQNQQTLHSLTVNGSSTVTLEKNATIGSLTLNTGTLVVGTDDAAAAVSFTDTAARTGNNGATRKVTLKSGSAVTDAAYWQLTGGSLTLEGAGTYTIAGMGLSANAANATTLNVEQGVHLHVTGTANDAGKNTGAFSLAHWNSQNTVNVRGVLELESGISTYSGYTSAATINVESGGKLALNNGLTAAGKDNAVTINVAGGATLQVSGTDTSGTNLVYVNVAREARIMGGAEDALLANDLVIDQGFYVGAAAGKTLTLAPESGTLDADCTWIDVLGTADGAGGTVVFEVDSLRLNALNVHAGGKAVITSDADLHDGNGYGAVIANGTLSFDGAGTITLNEAIQLGGTGTVEFLNAGSTKLVLSDSLLTENNPGLSMTWTLIDVAEGGTLTGWDKETLDYHHFLLNGEELSLGDWDGYTLENGKLTLHMLVRYWDATAGAVWNTTDANWRPTASSTDTNLFETNSRVIFTDTDEDGTDLQKDVAVADAGVHAKSIVINGSGYSFSGGAVLVDQSIAATQNATFANSLVIGSATQELQMDVSEGATLSVSTLETLSEVKNGVSVYLQAGGSFRKTGAGTLSITGDVQGIVNSAVVEGGTLQLAKDASLSVGSNSITGGSLQNVGLYAAGSVVDFTSGQAVNTTNVISSADGVNMGVLADVNLNAGSASAYASIQNVAFAGTSTLSGYITFEKTKHQREMAVATGGSLTVENLTFDLHGLSTGTKVLIENAAVADAAEAYKGSISGWKSITLTYSGVAVNAASVDKTVAGVVTIKEDGGDLHWDGLSEGAAAANWNTSSANWSATEGTDGSSVYYALSDTYFGATPQGAAKDINVAQDMVANRIYITEGGYSFAGYRVATLSDMELSHTSGAVAFNNELVVQGALTATNAAELSFGGPTTVVKHATLNTKSLSVTGNMTVLGDLAITSGSSAAGGAGSFTLGLGVTLSAANISLHVDAGAATDSDFSESKVTASGDISTAGALSITGTAAKDFTGAVRADSISVNTASSNVVSFNTVSANTLTITGGSTVSLKSTGGSGIGTINLAGTLGYDTFAGDYSRYNVVTTSADANVTFASITKVTLDSLIGQQIGIDAEDNAIYGSISFADGYRNLTINRLSTVQNLRVGQAEYGATLNNATGAIHGNLSVAAGAGLTVNSDNIMANGRGTWEIAGPLKLGATTQTLAGNTLELSGAVISGNANAAGLVYTEDATLRYTAINSISANMNVADGKTLTISAGMLNMDSLEISGNVSGSGDINLTGNGTVILSGANDYTGAVTVEGLVTLQVANTQALSHASLNLEADGILLADMVALGAPAEVGMLNLVASEPVTLDAETRTAGIMQLHALAATDVASAADAAYKVGEMSVSNAQTLDLLLSFGEGESLQTMKTYNLFTADESYSLEDIAEALNMELYVAFGNSREHVARNQYKVLYDEATNVISIRTMLGNIWSGGADTDGDGLAGEGIWSTTNTDKNWRNKDYNESTGFNSAIFVDLEGHDEQLATVTIQGTVTPGDIYFEADKTYYNLTATDGDGILADGTNIHKAGSAMVYLSLANNGTMEHAVGNVDLQAGTITLSKDLAVGSEVIVAQDAHLRGFVTEGGKLITAGYTAAGDFSGVTLGQDTISGLGDAKGLIASTDIYTQVAIVGGADAPVLLENVTLASYGSQDKLTNVAIGENVDVTGYYTLSGHVHFRDTLANTGTVNLDSAMTAEIGKLTYTFTVNETTGASEYTYQLVQGGQINGMSDLTVQDVYINGVNLSTGLADGVATVFTGNDGSLRLSIGNVTSGADEPLAVDGSVGMPKWDERWNNGNQPGLSRRYAGTDSSAVVTFAEGITDDTDHYYYSSVVNADNANAVNGEQQEIVVTLSAAATGAIAAGGATAGDASMEMWMYDRSGFDTVIAGRYSEELTGSYRQGGDTHLLINTDARHTNLKTWVVGGSWLAGQDGASYVTVQAGNILNLVGATYGANQEGASTVYIDGGRIYELFAGGFDASKNANYYGDVASVNLTITGGELGGHTPEGTPDALAGNKSVYGGSYYGTVHGDVNVTVDGTATITNLVGGGYAGTVEGAITLNLMHGTATTVNAAGIGNATAKGNVLVNLYDEFSFTSIYGGKQNSSGATVQGSSTLAFVEEDVSYDMTGKTLKGFDTISLADGATVKVSTDSGFATDSETGVLTVSGAGVLNLTGGTDITRDITLIDGATLWFNSDYAGNGIGGEGDDRARRTLTATAGTTIDITGQPKGGDGLCVWLDLAGHGVDGKGALYKGLQDAETSPSGKVALPRVTLSDSASVNAEDNIYFIEWQNTESDLYLNGHTLTKIGDKDLVLYNSTVKDNTDANAVVDGTIFVKEGTLGVGHGMRAGKTNVVLSEGTSLDILSVSDDGAIIGALSGSGTASLSQTLTITTDDKASYGVGSDFLDATEKYNQFTGGAGFAHAVYSGSMSGVGALNVKGDGTQYLSGNESSYAGGTHLYDSATLYLMGSTEGSMTKGSTTASGGVVGTGAIAWESAAATLYLGNGVQVFNNGTTNVPGSTMVIGVEAAPKGDKLTNYVGANSKGADGALVYITIDGVEYVEVATHNLSSISCNGIYADGSIYMADTLIDRNKMLLVSKAVWDADTATVSGFSAGGYNTATYSGVLSGNANLAKVGQGTLILDQTNTYTGTTTIEEGTLVLKGWAQIGGSKTSAALDVQQKTGSSLMLAYDGTYGDEITQITNDISINGTGDVRWTTEAATGHDTAALISTIGSGVSFALRGDITGDGNVLHAGAGTLVLSGDSTYSGGTHATTGVVEVQSAAGLGSGKVVIDATADLHATVEAGTTASRLTTAIKAADSSIQGDVVINGTADTERVLSMNTNGYDSSSTTLNDSGTLLVNGAAVQAKTALLKGTGTLAVSDATGQGATAQADALMDFTGDFVVEGNNAKIEAKQGNFNGGSMSISGQNAKVTLAGSANIAYGEKLELTSTGSAASTDNTAAALSAAGVSVAAGGTLSVSNSSTAYSYNLAGLQQAASAAVNEMLDSGVAGTNLAMGANANTDYTYHFDSSRALNAQTAGMVEGGLTLNSDSRYEEHHANISLAGGALTLNTSGGKIALNLLTNGNVQTFDDGYTSQIVLFSGVSSLTLDGTAYGEANAIMMMAAADGEAAAASNTIYSTLASNYFTGWNITDHTQLVYDVGAGVVYLDKAVPEPTTTTLSILALAALVARRRRR